MWTALMILFGLIVLAIVFVVGMVAGVMLYISDQVVLEKDE